MKANNISPCSGVILWVWEDVDQDIVDDIALKEMDANSIPINFLHPIKGTKFGSMDDLTPMKCLRIVALLQDGIQSSKNAYCWRKRGRLAFGFT
ncbi:hypothetical protein ACVNP0_07185 [Staphylococcus aureus]